MFAESAAYERFMGRCSRQLAPLFVTFAAVRDGHVVLDVGSGTGALAAAVAAASAQVTGVDPSAAYVKYAEARANGRARFVVGDGQQLPWPDASFDRTLSLLVINFIADPEKMLLEMIRVTRPGGIVAAAVWDYGDGMQMLRTFWDEAVGLTPVAAALDERNMRLCRSGQITALWRAHGLDQIDEQSLTIPLRFESFDDYWLPFLGGQGPAGAYATSLSNADRARLEGRLRARLLPGRDGPFTLPARAWAVKGQKLRA